MSSQLDILAFEPYFGGNRRAMLETVIRCSRHRWTLAKLPARRMERRLAVAARWFAEKLNRETIAPADLIFTSEAMNLEELLRLVPALAAKPLVVYFHSNQLPADGAPPMHDPLELVNLTTAAAATQVWFNSDSHRREFLHRCESLVRRHTEFRGRSPLPQIAAKCLHVPPPVDLSLAHQPPGPQDKPRDPRVFFVDLRGADTGLLTAALEQVHERGEKFTLYAVGPKNALPSHILRTPVHERDEMGLLHAFRHAGVYVSVRQDATSDELCIQALATGCWPVVPDSGVYAELLPPLLHLHSLHDGTPDGLTTRLLEASQAERPEGYEEAIQEKIAAFDAVGACRAMDERLERLVRGPVKT